MVLATTHAEIRLAVLGMAVMRTILPLPGDRGTGLFIAMCGRLSFGKGALNGSAELVGAAMCSTC